MNPRPPTAKTFVLIWVWLMLLLLLTFGLAECNLGVANTILAMLIAIVKMLLVLLIFMQVRFQSRITWVFAGAGFVWLLIFLTLTMGDYLTRKPVPPGGLKPIAVAAPGR